MLQSTRKLSPNKKRHISSSSSQLPIRFPAVDFGDHQDHEWCEVYLEQGWKRFRFHDYNEIYKVPGLYEHLFYRVLDCTSPEVVVQLFEDVLSSAGECTRNLRVLDLGAGNGMVGEELRRIGVNRLVGADLIPEAAMAAERDRPGLYDDYIVADFCQLPEANRHQLAAAELNMLVTVAALGFGDIPCKAFITAMNSIATTGWLAFNIKENFLSREDGTGFCGLIQKLIDHEIIQIQAYRRYMHRRSTADNPLYYVAVVAKKMNDVPPDWIETSDDQA